MHSKSFYSVMGLAGQASAFWRMQCGNIQTGRIDPIVSPGKVAGHVHKISGASNIGLSSTYDDLLNASCTSCSIQADKSAYWTPQLYYAHANGTFEQVPDAGTVVYYLGRGDNRTSVTPFPPGFRMVSGDTLARSYNTQYTFGGKNGKVLVGASCNNKGSCTSGGSFEDSGNGQRFFGRPLGDTVSFKCLGGDETETPGFKYTYCRYGLRAQLQFPTCWDGINLYKADNSHVAHMSQIDNGICPPSHPVQFVHLFFEVLYGVDQIRDHDGYLVFANGDSTGYGFHGDFLNGWDVDTLAAATRDCANTDNNGQISACPPLAASNSEQASYNCPEQPALVKEPVHGMLNSLPGCNKIEAGQARGKPENHVCPADTTPPEVGPTPVEDGPHTTFVPKVGEIYDQWKYRGCVKDNVPQRVLSGASSTSTNMTNDYCRAFCSKKGYPLAGLEYGSECYCGLSLIPEATIVNDCNPMVCPGNRSTFCGGPSRLSLWDSTTYTGPRKAIPSAVGDLITTSRGNIKYLGCAKDNSNGQRVFNKASKNDAASMTIEACADFCATKGASLAGLEYTSECFCGSALPSGGMNSSSCTMTCSGNVTEICGGSNGLSVWSLSSLGN